MKVLLYTEGYKTISKSGLGKAIRHQMQALEENNIEYTTNLKDDFDILHVNFYGPKSYFFTRKMRKKGKKIVYHAHSTEEDFKNSFLFSNLVSKLFKKWICTCYKLGDQIITPTQYSKKLLETYHLNRPIKAISNGIDIDFFKHNDDLGKKFREKYNYSSTDKIVVGIGLYIKRKGILDFVELAKRLPQYKFIWFGYSPLWASPREIRRAVNTKLDNLTFAGYVDSSVIKSALSGADLYLFPTLEETEGIPIVEALAAKIPTLIRDIPIFDEYPTDKVVYKAKTVDEFEEKIKLILEGKLPSLTENGYKAVKEKDLKIVGKKLIETYKETLNLPRIEEDNKLPKEMYFRFLSIILMIIIFFLGFLLKTKNFANLNFDSKVVKEENLKEFSRDMKYFDTNIKVKFYDDGSKGGERVLDEIEQIYKEYDFLTDRENKDSDLYKINHNDSKNETLKIDHNLYSLIKYGLSWYDKSDGLLNINTGSLTDIWNHYRSKKEGLPDNNTLEQADIDISKVVLLDDGKIKNTHPNLDLDNIRKGYATDKVIDMLKLLKIDKYIINIGSNVVVGNHYEENGKYNIAITSPFLNDDGLLTTLRLTNKAIVSKNLYQDYYHYAENDYGKIINPKTRKPANNMVGVTLIGDNCADTDALATILFLKEIEEGKKMVNKDDSYEAIWAYSDGNVNDYIISEKFFDFK